MINKLKRSLLMGAMVFAVSMFTVNCEVVTDPATDGPSCSYAGFYCYDLIDTDSTSVSTFELSCLGTYSDSACDTATYDVAGHCEYDNLVYEQAIFFDSTYYDATTALASCDALSGTWVD
jgi:hypothetical protein